ncbi:MAG: PTS sugar transporter subunit IIA [bacterium]
MVIRPRSNGDTGVATWSHPDVAFLPIRDPMGNSKPEMGGGKMDGISIAKILREATIIPDLTSTTKEGVLRELVERVSETYSLDAAEARKIRRSIIDREMESSTGMGYGFAIPQGISEAISRPILAVGISEDGVNFDAWDDEPVHIIFMLISPLGEEAPRSQMIARILQMLEDKEFRSQLMTCQHPKEIVNTIRAKEKHFSTRSPSRVRRRS